MSSDYEAKKPILDGSFRVLPAFRVILTNTQSAAKYDAELKRRQKKIKKRKKKLNY